MTAKHIADQLFEIEEDHLLMVKAGNMLLEQDRQLDILRRAFDEVCGGMKTSLELNKAQAERYYNSKTNPLTDDEIRDLEQKYIEVELFDEGEYGTEYNIYGVKDLIKEVERIHGIK